MADQDGELADRLLAGGLRKTDLRRSGQTLGRYLLASDHLGVLYDILPPSAPPYPPAVVTAIKDVRLQAILHGTRALSAAGGGAYNAPVSSQRAQSSPSSRAAVDR